MLELKEVAKSYGKNEVLHSINFKVERGKIIGLVGEDGAGKSTLLNIIATLNKLMRGTVNYSDIRYHENLRRVRKRIGYVPQDIAVGDHLTVRENMSFFEQLSWKRQAEDELRKLCTEMNLTKWTEKVSTLSGGMKR